MRRVQRMAQFLVDPDKSTQTPFTLEVTHYLLNPQGCGVEIGCQRDIRGSLNGYSCVVLMLPYALWQYPEITEPLRRLERKDVEFKWGPTEQKAYDKLVDAIANAPALAHPSPSAKLELYTDASDVGIGAVLVRVMEGGERRPIMFFSKALNEAQKKYSTYRKEALAIHSALRKMRKLLGTAMFDLFTDHRNLTPFLWTAEDQMVQRWALDLANYNFDIHHIKGEENVVADALSRLPEEGKAKVAAVTTRSGKTTTPKPKATKTIEKGAETHEKTPSEDTLLQDLKYSNSKKGQVRHTGVIHAGQPKEKIHVDLMGPMLPQQGGVKYILE